MYGMKNELESVVYYQAWGFHRAVQKFVAIYVCLQIWQFVMKINLKFQPSIQKDSFFALFFGCVKIITDQSHVFLKELHHEYTVYKPFPVQNCRRAEHRSPWRK